MNAYTFLFTDIEGSTRMWEANASGMQSTLAEHDRILRAAIESNSGTVFKTIGDAFCAVFQSATGAISAARSAQIDLQKLDVKVRMAIYAGFASRRDDDYFGLPLNRVARMLSAGHGGQILISESAIGAVESANLPNARDLGLHRLRDVPKPERIYQLLDPDLPEAFPTLKTDEATNPNNLPLHLTSFVGRDAELAEIGALLSRTRLLTLFGTGGCGKTRLALSLAESALEGFSDGVWLVELAAIRDLSLVAQTVASVLAINEDLGPDQTASLIAFLANKRLLLVLDNAEHVLPACAGLVYALLRSCAGVKVIATSREVLGVSGEQTYRVPSLAVPNLSRTTNVESIAECGSVQLFVERAHLVKPDFRVNADNAEAVAQLCARLDGIPLAIELAAVRLRSLSVGDIASRLDHRFRLLTGGDRTALPRQQTLRALVDWSYDLLTAQEMLLFQRLSVFAGGWTLEAAEQVAAGHDGKQTAIEEWEVLDLLTSLVDKSLLFTQETFGEVRYRMLETMRQYAFDRREEQGGLIDAERRHCDFYFRFIAEANAQLMGRMQPEVLERIEMEHDNLRLALDFCARDPDSMLVGLEMAGAMNQFWRIRGFLREARALLDPLLSLSQASKPTMARGEALFGAGLIAWMQGEYDIAARYQNASLQIRRELGDREGESNSLGSLAYIAHSRSDYESAKNLFQQSLDLRRALGNRHGIANSLGGLGMVAFLQSDFELARTLHAESLSIRRELEDREGIAIALINLGSVACRLDDPARGRRHIAEAMAIIRELGDRRLAAFALETLASVAELECEFRSAVKLHGAALALREAIGSPQPANEAEAYAQTLGSLKDRLGREAFEQAEREGRRLDFWEAADLAAVVKA